MPSGSRALVVAEPKHFQFRGSRTGRLAILDPILAIFLRLGSDPRRNGRSVKMTNIPTLSVFFWGLGPPEGSVGYLWKL